MEIIHDDALGVNGDRPSIDDVRWWAQQARDWHTIDDGPDLTDYDCSLDFEAEHDFEVRRYFRVRRYAAAGITSGDGRPDELDRWNGHPG